MTTNKNERGGGPRTNSVEASTQLKNVKQEIERMSREEKSLDEQIHIMQTNRDILLNLKDDANSKSLELFKLCFVQIGSKFKEFKYFRYRFVKNEELCDAFKTENAQTLILIKPHLDTLMEVLEPMYVSS
jgi:hypothetical protein